MIITDYISIMQSMYVLQYWFLVHMFTVTEYKTGEIYIIYLYKNMYINSKEVKF